MRIYSLGNGDISYMPANMATLIGGPWGKEQGIQCPGSTWERLWEKESLLLCLEKFRILFNYKVGGVYSRWRAQGGQKPRGVGVPSPAVPSACLPTYHDGSSCLGPKRLQHLPLHKEVGEEDDRGDLCDGRNSKGPLWKETQAIGLPLLCPAP